MQPAFPTFSRNRGAPVFEVGRKYIAKLPHIKREERASRGGKPLYEKSPVRPMACGLLLLMAQALPFRDDSNPDLFGSLEVAEGSSLAVGDEPVGF